MSGTLSLSEFPPVSTEQWAQAIQKDLNGADYDKRLKWRTEEGILVKPYYRAEDIAPRQPEVRGNGQAWEAVEPGHEPAVSVDASAWHEAGATAVQEAAFAIAAGADRLAAGKPVESFAFAIGSSYYMEIAKLRAVRLLWKQVAAAFGATPEIRIHARTASADKTIYDPYVNVLRVTTEAQAAVIGGCDSLTTIPFRFDAHLAANIHHILREESHLDKVADPAAGSYAIEALTAAVANAAWTLFQAIEAAGGFGKYEASGALDTAIAQSRAAKEKAVGSRRRVLVGTNNYPNVQERALDSGDAVPEGWRLASVFEKIRLRTERHAKATGKMPRVLLLERGDLKMRKARSAFCLNFFGCAGFEIAQAEELQAADLVVLCSSDPEYLTLAREVCPQTQAPVVVAGNPKEEIDALTQAGVAGFVHAMSNAVETLPFWQDKLGVSR
ncbi:MAG: methylmalonyl-CoA mutase family protein [Bryobacteraceae bacterium]